jgi:hypothetical protein
MLACLTLAAGCSGGTPSAPGPPPNTVPAADGIDVSPGGTGMVAHTDFRFTPRSARDADGDALSFTWRFGDGGTATSETATHVYETAGSFSVELSISDGEATVSSPGATVQVGPNLAGAWRHTGTSARRCSPSPCSHHSIRTLSLEQSGGAIAGRVTPNVDFVPTGFIAFPLTGSVEPVSHPGVVRFTTGDVPVAALQGATISYSFEGESNAAGTALIGTLTQVQKSLPFPNPFRIELCGSTAPVVTCPPVSALSTATFTR